MRCKAKTADGSQCRAYAIADSGLCFWHDPAQGEDRAKARKKGGQRRRVAHAGDPFTLPETFATIRDANKILDYTLAEVLPMENSIARARVLLSIHESYVRAIEVGELERRLAELEKVLSDETKGKA